MESLSVKVSNEELRAWQFLSEIEFQFDKRLEIVTEPLWEFPPPMNSDRSQKAGMMV
jgi:hypothetical protein